MTQNALALAQQKAQTGNLTDALTILSRALEKKPTDRDLLHGRAHVLIGMNRTDQAANDLDALIAAHPQDAQGLDDRGVLYQRQGNFLKAAEYHMQAVDLAPSDGTILNLAIALNKLGQRAEAEKLYDVVLQINPTHTRAMINLAVLCDERGQYDKAESHLKQAIEYGDESFELCMTYGNICRKQDRKDEALRWYEMAAAQRPDNGPAAFLVALMKGENPESPPPEHVAQLFDSYADNFESSLVGQLKYRTPDLLFNAAEQELKAIKENNPDAVAMDLGAGTGLFGKILRPFVKENIGLDLSANMLAKAQEQHIYDTVLCMDMLDGLARYDAEHFHVVAAADVFVYVGKLDALFKAIARSLAKDGLFIFSTEAVDEHEKGEYCARDTGRYAHAESYLKNLATTNGFYTVHFERTWIRYNKEKPLDGFVVVLRKRN